MKWLSLTVFLPLVGVPILLFSRVGDRTARLIAMLFALATFGVSIGVLANFHAGDGGFQLIEDFAWVKQLNLRYILGVDGVSLWMVMLSTFIMPIAILASWKVEKKVRYYMAAMLFLETAMIGSFVSLGQPIRTPSGLSVVSAGP